jgi:hypothetical protein
MTRLRVRVIVKGPSLTELNQNPAQLATSDTRICVEALGPKEKSSSHGVKEQVNSSLYTRGVLSAHGYQQLTIPLPV